MLPCNPTIGTISKKPPDAGADHELLSIQTICLGSILPRKRDMIAPLDCWPRPRRLEWQLLKSAKVDQKKVKALVGAIEKNHSLDDLMAVYKPSKGKGGRLRPREEGAGRRHREAPHRPGEEGTAPSATPGREGAPAARRALQPCPARDSQGVRPAEGEEHPQERRPVDSVHRGVEGRHGGDDEGARGQRPEGAEEGDDPNQRGVQRVSRDFPVSRPTTDQHRNSCQLSVVSCCNRSRSGEPSRTSPARQ